MRVLFIIALVIVSGCERHSGPSVTIDNWWTVDIAPDTCKITNSCGSDPNDPGGVQEYIDSLKAQFAASATCKGVSVFDYRGPGTHDGKYFPSDGEGLLIDYRPNQAVQHFSIMGSPSNGITGIGTVHEIVERSCTAARGLGAKVQ